MADQRDTTEDLPPVTGSSTEQHASESRRPLMQRALERTVDRLGRSRSSTGKKSQLSQSQPTLPAQSPPSRLMGLRSRVKGKEKASFTDDGSSEGEAATTHSQDLSSASRAKLPSSSAARQIYRTVTSRVRDDDSPFVTPRSPPLVPRRSDLQRLFRGNQSMHAGTQTLIQALQAMPWAEYQDDDDGTPQGDTPTDTSSDEDDDRRSNHLASSIHTIYRPLARSKRGKLPTLFSRSKSPELDPVSDREEAPRLEETVISDEELQDDFEPPDDTQDVSYSDSQPGPSDSPTSIHQSVRGTHRHPPTRSGSMGTVKIQRRSRLAEKLRDIFELQGIQEVVAEMPCWLLRSILLQGYMYLTDSYMCFFAHMPSKEDQVLKSGSMSKRAQRTKRWIRHWFVLKNDALSWYQSPSDPYFPHGIVDLRYAITCEPLYEREIRLRTNQKTIRLSADSAPSRDEWIKAIRKVMFRAQNMGDSVKIAIPYSAIADVEKSSAIDFSETIEIKVMDKDHPSLTDSYFFAYFRDLPAALEQIRDVVRASRGIPTDSHVPSVIDTTVCKPTTPPPIASRTQSAPPMDQLPKSPSGFRIPSLLRPLQESLPRVRTTALGRATSPERDDGEDYTHVTKRGSSTFMAVTASPTSSTLIEDRGPPPPPEGSSSSPPNPALHTYPPSPSSSPAMSEIITTPSKDGGSWTVGVPSWLRMPTIPSRRALTSALGIRLGEPHSAPEGEGVSEVISSNTGTGSRMSTSSSGPNDFGYFSVLEAPTTMLDDESIEKFRSTFAFDEKETLLGVFPGYVYRLLPVYGRLYVSTDFFCFKSSGPLTTRTRMVLPIRDILSTEMSRAFHFGHYGLVIIVRGHEELFFEFSDEERRAAFASLLERQMEDERRRSPSADTHGSTSECHDRLILDEAGPRQPSDIVTKRALHEATMSESLPAVMFNSASSTFLTFKPDKSLHFTFLTIGSRGDVQPYIALAQGLMKDGHRCRIATHGEFKDWIEAHGIEFGYVGGDPAELMRICVENGTFTVAFLKEGMLKFRGWVDDLLKTSWEACQGTDVLIESPSAMSGYHIAEALGVPYFRAFTMTWSRTRAYPHAFAVPEHKMGGNYNYMSYVLFDQVFWRATAGQINRWRRNTLGLGSTSLDRMEPHKIPFLYNFSPVIVPPPLDWPEWIHVTGYWFLNDADVSSKKWSPPPDLIEFLDSARKAQKKVVYIGFGSIVVSDPKSMTRCVIEAVVRSGVYAILSKGWSDRLVKDASDVTEPEEPLPKQIYSIASIPHDWLFQRVDAACHHGGAGTTGASLRGGIPTIIKPFFGDQFFWADRVEALGIGSAVRKLTVESLTQAFVTATTDQKQITRARAVGEKIRAEDGVGTAIEAIYRDLEYARSLVKSAAAEDLHDDGLDAEHATIRDLRPSLPSPVYSGARSGSSSVSSAHDAPSDWSVISDQE